VSPWLTLFEQQPNWTAVGSAVAVAFVVAWALAEAVSRLVGRVLPRRAAGERPGAYPSARRVLRIVRIGLLLVLFVVLLPPALELFGQPIRAGLRLRTLGAWSLANGLHLLLIVGTAALLAHIIGITTSRFQQYVLDAQAPSAEQLKRANTVSGLVRNVSRAFIFAAATVMVLNELSIDTKPLLAGAGIVGLGIGFGAQSLVKDVISGFFLIVDNLVRVGDVAEINGTGGLVEAINLRTIVLRDIKGAVHVFPCGSITTLTNLTKDFSYAVIDVTVAYRHDTDEVAETIKEAGASVREDPTFAPLILEPMEVFGIEQLGGLGVTMRARMKTLPSQQWNVARELRRRVKHLFDERGIQIPVTNTPTVPPSQPTKPAPHQADPPNPAQ
jgi:small-conductance mechanosensitive channel